MIKSPKIDKIESSNSYNIAIIDVAKNYETYINSTEHHAISAQDNDFSLNLLSVLNKTCGGKVLSVDTSFIASGVDSFELMMFLAQIYRYYRVKIDLLEMQDLDNISVLAKAVQKNRNCY